MSIVFGYLAAALIGVSLGMIGGGGSILTVPLLVYVFGIEPTLATAYSLFIVGITSLVGATAGGRVRMIDFRIGSVFAIPCFAAVYLTRRYIIPSIPDLVFRSCTFDISRDMALMTLFLVLMIFAGVSMVYRPGGDKPPGKISNLLLVVIGIIVGVLTGMVGLGGGFLIIPTLVLFAGLPMKNAIATSLAIIAVKSLAGFAGDIQSGREIDYAFITGLTAIAVFGIIIGTYASRHVESARLKAAFGWFVIVISACLVVRQVHAEVRFQEKKAAAPRSTPKFQTSPPKSLWTKEDFRLFEPCLNKMRRPVF